MVPQSPGECSLNKTENHNRATDKPRRGRRSGGSKGWASGPRQDGGLNLTEGKAPASCRCCKASVSPSVRWGQTAGFHQAYTERLAQRLAHTGAHTQQLFRKPRVSYDRSRKEERPSLRGGRTSLTGAEGQRVTGADTGCAPGSAWPIPRGGRLRVPAGTCTARVTYTTRARQAEGRTQGPKGPGSFLRGGVPACQPRLVGASDFSASTGN